MKLIKGLLSLLNSSWVALKGKPVWSSLGLVVALVIGFSVLGSNNVLTDYDIETASLRDVVNLVDVTGKVNSPDKVDLGLERGGKISQIEASVGDKVVAGSTLIVTSNSDLWARYAEAQANLAVEKLNLEEVRGTSLVDEDSAFTDLSNSIQDAYISAEEALQSKLSAIFRGSTSSSRFGLIDSYGNTIYLDLSINERLDLGYQKDRLDKALASWRITLSSITRDNILDTTTLAEENLAEAKDLLNGVIDAFDSYRTDDTERQAIVDAQRPNLFLARNLVSDASISLRNAKQDYLGELASQGSDSSSDLRSTLLQQERVNAAQARVNAALAEVSKSIIKAPFSGTVTKIDTEIGEIVSSNSPIVSMISDVAFEIEAFVAEADISRVELGKAANITLDAYGSDENFEAELIFVDPAETILSGVSTYRILLHFKVLDERIRSGMTANIEIKTGESLNTLAIPQRAVFNKGDMSLIRVFDGKEIVEREVSIGLKGFDGYIEILSGLEEGEQVVVFSRD